MQKKFLLLFFLLSTQVLAEDAVPVTGTTETLPTQVAPIQTTQPAVRPARGYDEHKESSSFIGDAESIDPLKARKDSLKEDDEPVLEDIRQVLNAPKAKKEAKLSDDQAATKTAARAKLLKEKNNTNAKTKKVVERKVVVHKAKKVKKLKKINSQIANSQVQSHRNTDEPDLGIEKTFHNIYQKYNSVPTSVEEWSKAAQGRMAEIYIVMKGDTLWSISQTLFGDPLFWPKIWALNKQGILNPHFILPGMKIRFFPGDNNNIPTLAVGEEKPFVLTESNNQSQQNEQDDSDTDVSARPKESQKESGDAQESSFKSSQNTVSRDSDDRYPPTPLPDSLPIHRNEKYYGKPRIVLVKFEENIPTTRSYANSIIFADKMVVSDLTINEEEEATVQCKVGEVIRNIKFKRAPRGEYTILQPLDVVKVGQDFNLRPYKIVGKVKSLDLDKIKILECHSALTIDDVYVPTELVSSLKTTKKIENVNPSIVGGPEGRDQRFFMNTQLLYMNFANKNVEVGQVVEVKSLRTESLNAKLKVLDIAGSFGVGIVTEMYESISAGDVLLLN